MERIMPSASTTVDINVSPEKLLSVITDFAAYPTFIPEMKKARVVDSKEDSWDVCFSIQMIRSLEYTLRLTKKSPSHIEWSLVSGVFKSNNGSWRLESINGGAGTRATYSVDISVGMFIPNTVVKNLVGKSLPVMLAQFKKRAESMS
jgi:ribosome-associated toxin RatA of RatAB toxin-antitoxin module